MRPRPPADVQATLTEFTAASCADAVKRFGKGGTELLVCGGGALNTYLMQRLAALLPGVRSPPRQSAACRRWKWKPPPLPGWHANACWACPAIWPA
jgi:sugar (pentulose or hexulose) kinase